MKRFPFFGIILMSIVLLGCFGLMEIGSPHVEEILHGYYTSSSIDHTAITKKDNLWPSPGRYLIYGVQDLDWTERFIVVKSIEYPKRSGTDKLTWYIIDTLNDQIHGPFYYDEYLRERQTLSVPDEIELLEPTDEKWEVYWRQHRERPQDRISTYMPLVSVLVVIGLFFIAVGIRKERSKSSH